MESNLEGLGRYVCEESIGQMQSQQAAGRRAAREYVLR